MVMFHSYTLFVCLLSMIWSGDASFYVERHVDPSIGSQPPEPPYYAMDLFANPSGCSLFVSTTCRRYGASCEGFFSCCYCECPKWATFVSLRSGGCKEGKELDEVMKGLGLSCQFVSVALPGNIPSYLKQEDLEAGLRFTLAEDAVGGVKLSNQETTCSALRLFYVNAEGEERLLSDNRCGGIFTVNRDPKTNGWLVKWNKNVEAKLWSLLKGKLLKFEIKCILDKSSMETLVSCLYVKVSGRYDDETSFPAINDMSCRNTTVAPTTTRPSTTNFTKTSKTMLPNATEIIPLRPKQSQSSSIMPIIGGAVGAVVFLLILAIAIVILVKRMKSRKPNDFDAYYSRPIMDYSDSANRGSTDPRYHVDHRVAKQPGPMEDAEYAVIEDTVPQDGPEYASADAVLTKVSFTKGPPSYQQSTNPYYRPASGCEYKAVPCDGMEKDNEAYLPSLPTAHPNLYEPSSSMPPTFGASRPSARDTNPVYDSPNFYEDMKKDGK